jgi:hypothetical protein
MRTFAHGVKNMSAFRELVKRARDQRKSVLRKGDNPGAQRARREREFAKTLRFLGVPSAEPPTGIADTARKIVEAGAIARKGGPTLPAPSGLAAQILAAGEKRRRPLGHK